MVGVERRERSAFGVGVIAALLSTFAMVVLRFLLGVPSLPEALADFILALLPAPVFAAILDTLGHAAKPLFYVMIAVGQLLVGGALGVLYARMRPGWWSALTIVAGLWAVFALAVFPLAGYGPLAGSMRGGPLLAMVALPLSLLVYAAYLVWGASALVPDNRPWVSSQEGEVDSARRIFLTRVGVGAAALAIGFGGWRALAAGPAPVRPPAAPAVVPTRPASSAAATPAAASTAPANTAVAPTAQANTAVAGSTAVPAAAPTAAGAAAAVPPTSVPAAAVAAAETSVPTAAPVAEAPVPGAASLLADFQIPGLSPEVSTNQDHYVVSKNLVDPTVDAAGWKLKVEGLVEKPYELTLDQLNAMPQVSRFYTLECISNDIGGNQIGTARWTGVPLKALLEQAAPKGGAVDLELHAYDDYIDSIPFERALHPDNLVALQMNGEALPPGHGFPARLLVPGIYGMKNVKWLTNIRVVDSDVKGFWQQRGWSDKAVYNTNARIDVPHYADQVAAGPRAVAGVAYAGDRGIQKVEVSVDGGATWQEAKLKTPLSPYTWVLWVFPWDAQPHSTDIQARATDGTGTVQPAEVHGTLPNGATGYHEIVVSVSS